jgi:hypothetical protein
VSGEAAVPLSHKRRWCPVEETTRPTGADLVALVVYLLVVIRDVEERVERLEERERRPVRLASATSASL